MQLLPQCTALVLTIAIASLHVDGYDFNATSADDSPVGSVIPQDAKATVFTNEVTGDTAAAMFTPTPTPTPTSSAATPTPTPFLSPSTLPRDGSGANDSANANILFGPSSSDHIQHKIRAGTVQSQGVNLGGWLVAEHWMNQQSDIWKGLSDEQKSAGEQTAFKNTPREVANDRFKWHRDNFITENDIAEIAKAGLNTVRVPVGYWIVGFDHHDISGQKQWQNYAPGALQYLDTLIRDWAKKYNLAVLISMHAAKGSQNGADHSSPEQASKSFLTQFPENIRSTLDAVTFLADRYKNEDAFLGIGLMNEPSGTTSTQALYKFYEDAYKAIRTDARNDCILTIAPLLWEQSANYMTDVLPGATNIWVEWHRYFVWGYETKSEEELLGAAMTQFRDDVNAWKKKSNKKMFIGEFSFATVGKFQDQQRLKEFGKRQMDVMFNTVDGGWTFWSWRIYGDENGVNPWSMRSVLRNNLFPSLPTPKQQS